ncbi:MAG: MFS transporter [Gammaproteobacteria bacterium]|nr:MFS transporter [Gammaproteobacteria bacterium]
MTAPIQKNSMDAGTIVFAGVITSAIGAIFYNTLPMYLGAAQDHRALGNEQIGLIGTLFFLGYTLCSSSAFFWVRKTDWRIVSYSAIAVAAFGLLVAGGSSSYAGLLAGVFVAGCGFAGIYAVGTTLLSDTSNPARWYGAKITAEAAIGVVLLVVLPAVVLPRWGFVGLSAALIVAMVLLAPSIILMPPRGARGTSEEEQAHGLGDRQSVWFALIACALFMCGQTAIWGFVERMGAGAGFNPTLVGTLLAVSLTFAVAGSLLAAWLGDRYGCLKPLIIAHLVFFLGLAALTRGHVFEAYALGACLVMFSVGLGISYAVSTIAELDPDGRFVVLSVPAIGVGIMFGPGIAGFLAKGGSYAPVLAFGFFTLLISLLAFKYAERHGRHIAGLTEKRETS